MENWIIVDIVKKRALYGRDDKTLTFSSKEVAAEVAMQFFKEPDHFMLIYVNLPSPPKPNDK